MDYASADLTEDNRMRIHMLGHIILFENKLWGNYVYLDTDERRRFSEVSHEYLIEQLQFNQYEFDDTNASIIPHIVDNQGAGITRNIVWTTLYNQEIDLQFTKPIKEIIWGFYNRNQVYKKTTDTIPFAVRANFYTIGLTHTNNREKESYLQSSILNIADNNVWNNIQSGSPHQGAWAPTGYFELKLNDRSREREQIEYFTRWQIMNHHSGYGGVIEPDSIAVYSFALKPEEHQPSGTCNFSKIDKATLCFENVPVVSTNYDNFGPIINSAAQETSVAFRENSNIEVDRCINVYAINYNILRIMSGMAGLAYIT